MAEPTLISVNLDTRTAFFSDGSSRPIDLRDERGRIVEEAALATLFTVRGLDIRISLESARAARLIAAATTANEARCG